LMPIFFPNWKYFFFFILNQDMLSKDNCAIQQGN
jgi:hypothetical protein